MICQMKGKTKAYTKFSEFFFFKRRLFTERRKRRRTCSYKRTFPRIYLV